MSKTKQKKQHYIHSCEIDDIFVEKFYMEYDPEHPRKNGPKIKILFYNSEKMVTLLNVILVGNTINLRENWYVFIREVL